MTGLRQRRGGFEQSAEHDHVARAAIAQFVGDVREGAGENMHVVPLALLRDRFAVVENPAAGRTLAQNLSSEGSFIATSTSGWPTRGESMGSRASRT